MAKPSLRKIGKENSISPQIPLLTHPTSQINLHKDPYQLQNDNEIMTRTNKTNPKEDCCNESLLILLYGQQDLQNIHLA